MQESVLNVSKEHSPEVRNLAPRAPVCHPIRPRSCLFREPTSMIPGPVHAQTNRRTSEEARLIELLAARCCTGGSKRAKAGEIVNRSIILNPFLLQDTHQRPIDLGVSSSYLRDELEGHCGACCRTSSLPVSRFSAASRSIQRFA